MSLSQAQTALQASEDDKIIALSLSDREKQAALNASEGDKFIAFSLSDAGFELQNQLLALHSDPQLWSQISLQGYKRASELSLKQQQQQLQVMMGAFR